MLFRSGAGATDLTTTTTIDYFATLADAMSNSNGGQTGGVDWTTGTYPKYVRVTITAQAPMVFLPLLNRSADTRPSITVRAVAGLSQTICNACGIDGIAVVASDSTDTANYGFLPGQFYTLYLSTTQQIPNAPAVPAPQTGTL